MGLLHNLKRDDDHILAVQDIYKTHTQTHTHT